MQRDPAVALPEWTVADLERALLAHDCGGFPVVDQEVLVGVVSRSDLVRRTATERAREEELTDFFREFGPPRRDELSTLRDEAHAIADHLIDCKVADLMSPPSFVVESDASVHDVAGLLVEHHIHRVPVVENGKLVGIVSTLDLVALLASQREEPASD